jgi:hypothetical protein
VQTETDLGESLLAEIVLVQPLRRRVNHVDDGVFTFSEADAIHGGVEALLVKRVKRCEVSHRSGFYLL